MDDKNILELHVEQQDTDGTAKRAAEYHKRLIHQASILSEKEYQKFLLERLEKDNGFVVRKAAEFDRYYAVDREMLFKFLNDTQSDTMEYLRKIYKDDLEETIVSFINAETISICQLIIEGMLITTDAGEYRLASFVDEQRMCRLYEKFILEYYSKHFPELSVSASQIPWSVDDGIRTMLPVMQSDIHLQKGNTVLIIDAKYYSHTTQTQYDKHTLHSNNMYQIFTYVKNRDYEFGDEDHKVSGMLLYAKTEEEIQPDNVYQMHGNQITVRTLDLNLPFWDIAKQLNIIAETHFDLPERSKG